MKTTAAIIGAGALLLGGCAGGDASPGASATPSASPSPSPSAGYQYHQAGSLDDVVALPIDYSTNQEYGIGLSDVFETDRYGSYRGLVLDDSSSLFSNEWAELSRAATTALTGDEITDGITVAVRFMVEEWIDSPLTWDDDEALVQAWFDEASGFLADDTLDYNLNSVLDPEARDFGTLIVDADVASWRENGSVVQYRPAPYEDGVARAAVDWFMVSGVDYQTAYTLESGKEVPASLLIETVAGFERPVILMNGDGPFAETTEGSWTVELHLQDGQWRVAEVTGGYSQGVSLRVDGGLEALPTLDSVPGVPRHWEAFEVDGLAFALPASYEAEDPTAPILQFGMPINLGGEYSLYKSDDAPEDWAFPRWAKMEITSWGWGTENPIWMIRPYGDSYVLDVPGAAWAGSDVYPVAFPDGSIREYVEVTIEVGEDRAYWFEAVVPEGEGLDFLRDFAATLELT